MSKVNPNEAPEGYVAVELTNSYREKGCPTCEYNGDCSYADCNADDRKDGKNVIFKKKPEGMTFEEILPLLREGKEVRRPTLPKYVSIAVHNGDMAFAYHREHSVIYGGLGLSLDDLNATDWEEYKEDSK